MDKMQPFSYLSKISFGLVSVVPVVKHQRLCKVCRG